MVKKRYADDCYEWQPPPIIKAMELSRDYIMAAAVMAVSPCTQKNLPHKRSLFRRRFRT